MSLFEHVSEFAGKRVVEFDGRAPFDPSTSVPRIALDWESHVDGLSVASRLDDLFARPDVASVTGLVFGAWDFLSSVNSSVVVEGLVGGRQRLPELRALFIGDIVDAEQEMAWIAQSNLAPILPAFPKLEELRIRGSSGLALSTDAPRLGHPTLKSLIVESAGLSREVANAALAGEFPQLRHLELWLGSEAEGGTVSLDDLAPLFDGRCFPALESLALKNAETADALAAAIASAPIVARLRKLDLSLGTLSDDGAEALLASTAVRLLRDLDLRKSYLSPAIVQRFRTLQPVIADVRGSRFTEDGERRPSSAPPKRAATSLDLALPRLERHRASRRSLR